MEKKVPQYTAIPFLVTAPVINPIVLFATYTAFGNSMLFATYRALGAILVSVVLGIILGFFVKNPILKENKLSHHQHDYSNMTSWQKVGFALIHAIDEFFDTGRYLVFGCLFASLVQVYIPALCQL